jgi:predicted membrane protein DUF2157
MRTKAPADLAELLDRWVAAQIISNDQADRIRANMAAHTPARTGSLVTEAMGYLGGVIVVVGLALATGWFWADLPTAARVGLTGAVAGLLLAAGAVVPARAGAAGVRLRSVLWLAASVASFACLSLLAGDGFGWSGARLLVWAGGGACVVSAALWVWHPRVLQQAGLGFFALVTAGATTSLITGSTVLAGVAVWAVGAVWCVAGALQAIPPARGALVMGAAAAVVGSVWVEGEGWGTAIALVTVAALVAAAVRARDLVLLAVASLGTLVVLPELVVRYFPGLLSAALTLVVVGLALVGLAVLTARRRRRPA